MSLRIRSVETTLLGVTLSCVAPAFGQISSPVPRQPISDFLDQGKYLASGGEHVFVAPRPGVLRIIPQYIAKAFNDVPDTAYLKVRFSGTSNTTTLPPYFACTYNVVLKIPDNCNGGTFTLPYYSRQHSNFSGCISAPLDTFYTANVNTGDTVRFTYHAELVNPTFQEITMGSFDSSWTVFMGTLLTNANCFSDPWFREEASVVFSFADTLVKIRRPDSVNVYPTYSHWYNQQPGKRNYLDQELLVEFANSVIPNYWVKVDKPAIVDSGGHAHNGTRPMGRYRLPKLVGQGFDTLASFTRQADANGKLTFRYLASQFGGVEIIRAMLLSDTTKFDTLSLITIVKGLDSLATSQHYLKVGAPGDWDTCDTSVPNSLHYHNHYGIPALLGAIDSIARRYYLAKDSVRLRVNDISLKRGGLFDINNNWRRDHGEHREGKHADIAYDKGINPKNDCPTIEKETLRKLIRKYTTDDIYEHPASNPHFHIRMK